VPDKLSTPRDQSVKLLQNQSPVPKKQSLRSKRTSQLQAAHDAAYDDEPPKLLNVFMKAMFSIEVGDKENISPAVLTSSSDFRIKVMVDREPGVRVVQYNPAHDFSANRWHKYLEGIVLQAATTGRSWSIDYNLGFIAGYLDAEGDNCFLTSGHDIPSFEMAGGLAGFIKIQVHSAAYIKRQTTQAV
jgi:hypothetical protein